jgi:hypothetical protein
MPDDWWTRRRAVEAKAEALVAKTAAFAEKGGTLESLTALNAELTALNVESAALLEERRKLTIKCIIEHCARDQRYRHKPEFADAELRGRMTALLMADGTTDGTLDMGPAYTAAKAEEVARDRLLEAFGLDKSLAPKP